MEIPPMYTSTDIFLKPNRTPQEKNTNTSQNKILLS